MKNSPTKQFIITASKIKNLDLETFEALKRKFAKKSKMDLFSNTLILETYQKLVKRKKIKKNKTLRELLTSKKTRTASGIASIACFTKPYPCPGKCLYCPSEPKMPKSYLSDEPAVMRAIRCKYSPKKQILARISALEKNGHPTDKIELIIMGGTFSVLPRAYQSKFITNCFKACNEAASKKLKVQNSKLKTTTQNLKLLKFEQQKNEKTKHRIIGLTLETRPDYINEKEIKWMRELGATRIELGVQSIYDDVLIFNNRGHLVQKTIKATRLLKDAGFKINYHIMPNLPKSNQKRDFEMISTLFSNQDFQPDMLKIYPCVLTRYSRLYHLWEKGEYKPYHDRDLINLLIKIKQKIPPYVRIMRLGRDIPAPNIVAGNKISNIREEIKKILVKKKISCQCIRCREIRDQKYNQKNVKLIRREYWASKGKEIFLSFEDVKQNKLLAFLRLRIPSQYFSGTKHFINILNEAALIREIHTYGELVPISKKGKVQHLGFGKKLVLEAEKIVKKEYNLKKIAVISGVGVRNYWRKLGYRLKDTYMVKSLNANFKD